MTVFSNYVSYIVDKFCYICLQNLEETQRKLAVEAAIPPSPRLTTLQVKNNSKFFKWKSATYITDGMCVSMNFIIKLEARWCFHYMYLFCYKKQLFLFLEWIRYKYIYLGLDSFILYFHLSTKYYYSLKLDENVYILEHFITIMSSNYIILIVLYYIKILE